MLILGDVEVLRSMLKDIKHLIHGLSVDRLILESVLRRMLKEVEILEVNEVTYVGSFQIENNAIADDEAIAAIVSGLKRDGCYTTLLLVRNMRAEKDRIRKLLCEGTLSSKAGCKVDPSPVSGLPTTAERSQLTLTSAFCPICTQGL